MKTKIFVGTLYSGEKEFYDSVASVRAQQDVDVEHYIVPGKREKEAHDDLYAKWLSKKDEFDLFVKVDADMVLGPTDLLKTMFASISADRHHNVVTYMLDDFLTNTRVIGVHGYTKRVDFKLPVPELFCDRCIQNRATKLVKSSAGQHSPDPSLRQAFHFGFHRGFKHQFEVNRLVTEAFRKLGDDRRALAISGFAVAQKLKETKKDLTSYNDELFKEEMSAAIKGLDDFKSKLGKS